MSRPAMASRSPANDAVAAREPKGRLGAHAFPRPSGGALMSRGRSLLVAVVAAAPLAAQRPATLPRPLRGLDAYVTAALRTWDVPGLAVARWKSTRLNSSHVRISYAVFCLKKNNLNHDLPDQYVQSTRMISISSVR